MTKLDLNQQRGHYKYLLNELKYLCSEKFFIHISYIFFIIFKFYYFSVNNFQTTDCPRRLLCDLYLVNLRLKVSQHIHNLLILKFLLSFFFKKSITETKMIWCVISTILYELLFTQKFISPNFLSELFDLKPEKVIIFIFFLQI